MKLESAPRSKSENDKLAELKSAHAELQRVKAEAAAAQQATEQLRAHVAKSRRDTKFRLRVVAVVMLTAALIKILWLSAQAPPAPPKIAAPLPPAASTLSRPDSAKATGASDYSADAQFSHALNRLRDAFQSFPGEDQMDIVREINEQHTGGGMACPLAWNEAGVPSLFLGDKKSDAPPSIVTALNQCASAIEKLRAATGRGKPL